MTKDPTREPAKIGANLTPKVQVAPAARLAPQVPPLETKSEPVILLLPKTKGALPLLLTVTVLAALMLPTVVVGKVKDVVETLATGIGVGVGTGVGVGVGVGTGVGVAVGVGVGTGVRVAVGVGDGAKDGDGVGDGEGVGDGVGDGIE
jgi:hypothetical protein